MQKGTRLHYSLAQRLAWGRDSVSPDALRERLEGLVSFVAELDEKPVGFMTIDATGYIDLAFVLPSAVGKSVGWKLYEAVETRARELGAVMLTTEASKVARPFFERQGWIVVEKQTVYRQGVDLVNYKMRKAM